MPIKRALIVDDSTTAQYRLKKMLQAYNLDIDIVDSGEAALLYLAKHVPDVVFMDHLMPGMDGFRVLQIIKSHPETAMIPVIMYTSKSGDVYTGQARALGALDVITKDTINSADLSNVLRSIHIDAREKTPAAAATESRTGSTPTAPEIPAIIATENEKIVARAAQQLVADNSRRIELRIVQLEHAIDDSRRVIAAQLIREMQKLRHNLKHELTRLLNTHEENKVKAAAEAALLSEPEKPSGGTYPWSIFLLLLIFSVASVSYSLSMNNKLQQIDEQQSTQYEQLNLVVNSLLDVQAEQINQQLQQSSTRSGLARLPMSNTQLEDFIWAFNQSSKMPFSPRLIEADISLKLFEFVNRMSDKGYEGLLWINLTVGNFCVVLDSAGQAQLPDHTARIADCMLFSELYPLETMIEQAIGDITAALLRIPAVSSGAISVIISQNENALLNYPQRESQLPASDWNHVAQNKNQIVVALSGTATPQ
jgi:CheY-like chemotaxis protein